jgi:hypothetical protein
VKGAKLVPSCLPPCRLDVAAVATGARFEGGNHLSILVFAVCKGKSAGTVEVLVVHVVPETAAFARDVIHTGGNDDPALIDRSSKERPGTGIGNSTRGKAEDSSRSRSENGSFHGEGCVGKKITWEV